MAGLTGDSSLAYIGGRQMLSPAQQKLQFQIILCVKWYQEYNRKTRRGHIGVQMAHTSN